MGTKCHLDLQGLKLRSHYKRLKITISLKLFWSLEVNFDMLLVPCMFNYNEQNLILIFKVKLKVIVQMHLNMSSHNLMVVWS